YDRFRDRVMFPIRDGRGNVVGFGGRILPSSPLSARVPKYYNSTETALFSKSSNLYGIDQARQAGASAGYLAVVEGYTDVLMAHQGPEPFQTALTNAVDVLEFKLQRVLRTAADGVEARRLGVDEMLRVIALAPQMQGQTGAIKRQLLVTRISQRLGLKEDTIR